MEGWRIEGRLRRGSFVPSVAETLSQAKAYHRAGQLPDALQLYRRVLAADSGNAEAHYLLGAACHGLGQANEAISSLAQAIQLQPDHAEAHNHLGAVLAQEGKLDEAIASFQQALRLRPGSAEISENLRILLATKDDSLGNTLTAQGKLDEAAACYGRAVEQRPDFAEAHNSLGAVWEKQGRFDEAAACCRRALELKPDFAEAHYNLGAILAKQTDLDGAVACYRRALQLNPDLAEAHNNLAAVLKDQNKLDEAAACCRRTLELKPDFAEAHANLAAVFQKQEKFDEAVAEYRRTLELNPDLVEVHNELAVVLSTQGRFDEAAACWRRALELKPDFAEAHHNRGIALMQQGKPEEALTCLREALEVKPDFAEAHNNRAMTLIQLGRFTEGWPEYEWRWKRKGQEEPILPQPRWTGTPLAGRTILLRSEQGLGDTLQFIRYAEHLKQQGGTVIAEIPAVLARLVARCPGVDRVVAVGERMPAFDVHLPLLSLPGMLHTTLENIPANVPYLSAAEELVQKWQQELGSETGFKIGIAWQGNRAHPSDRTRSIPLARFAGLARIPGVRLYSLQMGAGREQLTELANLMPITDLGDRLGDFHNTAAILGNLDLVISCDSAPVHLAGALGVRVWVALAFAPDWRWMLGRTDSPWYPTMRLFRQNAPGDWEDVFQKIQAELIDIVPRESKR